MIKTIVIEKEVNYNRLGILKFENNKVIFDTSDGEYGPVTFNLELLYEKIKEHKLKLNK
jgi:hypothetical protein